jgi:hypothetical protein
MKARGAWITGVAAPARMNGGQPGTDAVALDQGDMADLEARNVGYRVVRPRLSVERDP